ncbi:MAG: cation diffusion facilitator family transporter [Candidatus Izimaplasma sp.]|nr:cation diffusion facilitator family transporter [Candidatus Izimaplasma bacterium]
MSTIHTKSQKNLKSAFWINLIFTVIEIIGGIMTNSIAILSDAVHDLGDSISLGIAWGLELISNKKPDKNYTFGYERFSLLGGIISSLVLVGGSVFILTETISRLLTPQQVNPLGMLAFSIIGIVFNYIAYRRVHGSPSLNEKAVSLHLLEDVLGWVAVFIGSLAIYFFGWHFLDPLLSIFITGFILLHVIRTLREIFTVLLQKAPKGIDIDEIKDHINQMDHCIDIYHTHLWSLDGEQVMLSTTILIDSNTPIEDITALKKNIKLYLKSKGITHITIECAFKKGGTTNA